MTASDREERVSTIAGNRGMRWAYLGAIVGGAVSVLANIAHSFVPPNPEPANWAPHGGAIALAAFWPLALLLAIEVLARVSWPRQLRWTLVRWGGVSPVALVAAVVSYRHLSGLLLYYGEDPITVTIGPAAVDGLMVVSTGALLALSVRVVASAHAATTDPIAALIAEPSVQEPTVEPPALDPLGGWVKPGVVPSGAAAPPTPAGPSDDEWAQQILGGLADEPERVVALRSVPTTPTKRATTSGPRPGDLERAREAIRAGHLSYPLTADAIRDHLKVGLKHARLVRDALQQRQAQG